MQTLSELRQRNVEGFPRPIYTQQGISIEIWKFNKVSLFALIIPNGVLTEDDPGFVEAEINGVDYLVVSLPPDTDLHLRHAIDGERFQGCAEDDVLLASDHLVVFLGITLSADLGKLFDQHHVAYDRAVYSKSREEWGLELDRYMTPED
jgi:hypothetical protein